MSSDTEQLYSERMREIKAKFLQMAGDEKITWETYEQMTTLLEKKIEPAEEKLPSDFWAPPKKKDKKGKKKTMVAYRVSVLDEIPPPIPTPDAVPHPGSEPALEAILNPAPPAVSEEGPVAAPEPELVPDAGPEPVDEHPPPPDEDQDCVDIETYDDDSWYFPDTEKDKNKSPGVQKAKTLNEIINTSLDCVKSQSMRKIELESPKIPKKGCLFMTCIRCVSMIMIQFESGTIPPMPLASSAKYQNGVVMTMCKHCMPETEIISTATNTYGTTISHTDQFTSLKMDPELLTGSMMLRTANLVVGEHVHMMKFKNRILYMERERIINMVSCVDKIVSLNPWVIESGDLSRVLLQHVNGGFI
jgi:hypothetical protein